MDVPMTKARLLDTLREKHEAWKRVLDAVPSAQMTVPGVAGEWSVKDIIAHLTDYERWMADRLQERLRGESYVPTATDAMHWDERNNRFYERNRDRPLAEVLESSQQVFGQLMAAVQAHSEAFLTEPQQFEGVPQPIIVWQMLRSEVYDHYARHIPDIERWLAAQQP